MKRLFILSLLLIISSKNFSQEEESKGWNYSEIFMITRGLSSSETIRYKMEAQGTVWTQHGPDPPSNYTITDTLNLAYYPPLSQLPTGNTNSSSSIFMVGGFNFVGGGNQIDPYPMDSYGYGFYKISTVDGSSYFYINYRDNRYRSYTYTTGHGQDIWVRYNAITKIFSYRNNGPNMQNLDSTDWIPIANCEYLSIWAIKNQIIQGSPQTDQFPNYWQNCLVVIPKKASDGIEVPYLVWGPIPNFQVTGYKIYCSINTQGGPPGNFNLIAQVDANTTEYMHEGLAVGHGWKVYYKVKAFNDSNESGFTNIAEIGVSGFYKDNSNNTVDNYNFNLYPNHPNPFNPTTIIKYQLPEDAHVKLIIYDVLGREVTTLVNEFKKLGSYEVEFDARLHVRVGQGSKLSSGIYFYQLKVYPEVIGAGSQKGQAFIQTKKAFLMK